MDNNELINILEYIGDFEEQRYRAMVIHATPEKGPSMTEFSKKVCKSMNGKYLDLLEVFIQNKSLAEKIDIFSPEKLKDFLISESTSEYLLLVDRADFLLDTWSKNDRQDFYQMIRDQWDGYKETMKPMLIFCLQTSQELESLNITDSKGNQRVFRFTSFSDIA